MAQISPIKFSKELQKQLFPDNEFYKYSRTETGIGPDVENVEIPVSGDVGRASSGDPVSLPLPILEREDTKKSYPVEQLYTSPYLVRNEESIVLNYDKLTDVASSLANSINERAGDIAATEWGSTANVVLTTGSARNAYVTGTTGTRKAINKANMLSVKKAFNKMNLPNRGKNSLYGLLTAEQVEDLLGIADFVDYDKTGELSKLRDGEIAYIMGFNLMMRTAHNYSNGVMYNAAGTAKRTVDETLLATDSPAAIFWHRSMVRHAEGNAKTFINRDQAAYLGGTILSSVVRFGATFDRPDEKGIVALVEAT